MFLLEVSLRLECGTRSGKKTSCMSWGTSLRRVNFAFCTSTRLQKPIEGTSPVSTGVCLLARIHGQLSEARENCRAVVETQLFLPGACKKSSRPTDRNTSRPLTENQNLEASAC